MKISPEPDWKSGSRPICNPRDSDEDSLDRLIKECRRDDTVIVVFDNHKRPAGSFTPEWFLSLPREHQLRFLSVAKRMHETGVDL